MNPLYTAKHRVWLSLTFASLAIEDEEIKSKLYDFSLIAFRHMKWIGEFILESGEDYNYDRDGLMLYRREDVFEILKALKEEIINLETHYSDTTLFQRIQTDEKYFVEYIDTLLQDERNNHPITAFNMQRKWEDRNLEQSQIDALTLFLFDESYKEYELILVYAYMQTRTNNALYYNVFQDLIDESHFHLKSFGNMMAKLGILALPRELHELTYIVDDLEKFIVDGIAEEEAAKIQCKELSDAIKDEELSKFFDFINYQENYHIELMQKLLRNL
jgi:hypothetical protein